MESHAEFRYLRRPYHCWVNEGPKLCVVCQQLRPGYFFIDMHDAGYDEHNVCEECLVAGRLIPLGLRVNEANREALRQQMQRLHPELSAEWRETLAAERTTEVEQRTPYPAIGNTFLWPAHCGDYCIFCKQVNTDDVNELAADGNGKQLFASHLHPDHPNFDDEAIDGIWQEKLEGFWQVYLWICPVCASPLFTFSCD